jgi:uncharacterized glyoxalase superfamily protein PhnB
MATDQGLPTIYPGLVYRDCPAAIDWLTRVLGFTRHLVVNGRAGRIDHAELRFGNGLVMVSSTDESGMDWLGESPGSANVSLVAESDAAVDALYARVESNGARIVRALSDSDFGPYGRSHGFTCVDPEGHRWSIGTYQPASRPPAA